MIEIFVLLALVKPIEYIASRKGEKPYKWRLITIGSWFGAELLGGFTVGLLSGNMLAAYIVAIACAISSYFVVKYKLKQMPDKDDLLETIGQEVVR